jgi:alpha-L-fucosidase
MKTPLRFHLGSFLVALATPAFAHAAPAPVYSAAMSERSIVKPYDAAQQARMKWFNDARLGMFIHWGLYAVPAGQWPGRTDKNRAEWIMIQEDISSAEYEKLAPQFKPVKFDAKAWVEVAKSAGMKYIVITAKHHDGFSMYDSKASAYNIVAATPFKRDPLKELAAACRDAGIVFCVYYSIADWHYPDSPAEYSQRWRDPVTGKQDPKRGFHGNPKPDADVKKYDAYMRDQVRELLTNYGPIGIVWFDGGGAFRVEGRAQILEADQMAAMIHQLQPAALINNRLGFDADYGTPEQRIPGGKTVEPFEVCMTLNGHWGYNRFDEKWKSPMTVVRNIADIVSKGGNYLLNVGPTAEGEIPAEGVRILREVGAWTTLNAAAIYGAGPTPFGDELGYEVASKKDKEGNPVWVDRNDWRCTTQPGKLFFTLLTRPSGSLQLPAFPNRILRAYLTSAPQSELAVLVKPGSSTFVNVPASAFGQLPPVLCVEIEGSIAAKAATGTLDAKKDKDS